MTDTQNCFICPKPAVKTCTLCGEVTFCQSHETFHNNSENTQCFPFTVDAIEGVGRVIKASRDIVPGEEIFCEPELVVGPSRSVPPVCLGCGRRVSGHVRCTGCRWPLCSAACPDMELHTAEECRIIGPTGHLVTDCDAYAENCSFYQVCLTHVFKTRI